VEQSRNPAQRRLAILRLTRDLGRIEVDELADRLDVAIETVRRDLSALEKHGLIRRTHGTAYPLEGARFQSPIANIQASWSRRSGESLPPQPHRSSMSTPST